jgi:hypothetical protein
MTKIQIVLMAGVAGLGVMASALLGGRLVNRLALLGLMSLGLFLIAFPDVTTEVARALGVGRGTDLLLYLWIVTGCFAAQRLYARIRRVERKVTLLTREIALRDARATEAGR